MELTQSLFNLDFLFLLVIDSEYGCSPFYPTP